MLKNLLLPQGRNSLELGSRAQVPAKQDAAKLFSNTELPSSK